MIIDHNFNSLWPSDAIWQHRSGSTLLQVMACCLTAPSHYLKQCWLIIKCVLWHSPEGNFTKHVKDIYPWLQFKKYKFNITSASPRAQWVKFTKTPHLLPLLAYYSLSILETTDCHTVCRLPGSVCSDISGSHLPSPGALLIQSCKILLVTCYQLRQAIHITEMKTKE